MFNDKRLTKKELAREIKSRQTIAKANEWWVGLGEDQKNVYLDEWILKAYKDIIED